MAVVSSAPSAASRARWRVAVAGSSTVAFLLVTTAYLYAFTTTGISSFGQDAATGELTTRGEFWLLMLQNPQYLMQQWVGGDLSRASLLDRVPLVAAGALWLAACYGPGRLVLLALRLSSACTRAERFVFSLSIGLAICSTITLLIGLCGQLHWTCLHLLAPIMSWTALLVVRVSGKPEREKQAAKLPHRLWVAAIPFAAIMLLAALLPPLAFDAKCYHLQSPKEFAATGEIGFVEHNVYANMPLGAEMHVLSAILLWPGESGWWYGAITGKLILASCSLLAALAVYCLALRWRLPEWAAVLAGVLYLSTPWIHYVSVSGLIDGVVAMYGAVTLLAITIAFASRAGRLTSCGAVTGLAAGAAVACKYPALLFIAAPAFAALAWRLRVVAREHRSGARLWFPVAVMILCFTATGGVWMVKNAVLTGNPVYPLMAEWFPTHDWSETNDSRWSRVHSATEFGVEEISNAAAQVGWRSNWLSPLLWPLAALALLAARDRKRVAMLAILAASYFFLWWLLTHRVDRFWLPLLPVAALLAAFGAASARSSVLRISVAGLVFAGLSVNLLTVSSRAMGDNRFLLGYVHARSDVPSELGGFFSRVHPAHRLLNAIVQPSEAVLLVGDFRPFDIERPVIYNTPFDRGVLDEVAEASSREARRDVLHDCRADWIYFAWADIARERSPEGYGFNPKINAKLVSSLVADGLIEPFDWPLPDEVGQLFRVKAYRSQSD